MILFFRIGIIELIWAEIVNSCIAYFVNSYFSAKLLSYSTKDQIKDIMPIFIVSFLMGIIVYFSGTVLPDNYFIKLVVQIFIEVVAYIGISRIVRIEELKMIYNLIGLVLNEAKNRLNISIND